MALWENITSSKQNSTPLIEVNKSSGTELLIQDSTKGSSNTVVTSEILKPKKYDHNPSDSTFMEIPTEQEPEPPRSNLSSSVIAVTSKEAEPEPGASTTHTNSNFPIPDMAKILEPCREKSFPATSTALRKEIKKTAHTQRKPSRGSSTAKSEKRDHQYLERSKHNCYLMKCIQRQPMAMYWEGNYKPYVLRTVSKQSSEFRRVNSLFRLSNRGLFIRKLQHVENPFLLGQYLLKKEDMLRRNLPVRERLLFHGTTTSSVRGICSKNFDWRLYGFARGHKFGHGVCFSPEVSYASQFGQKVMILTRVLVAKTVIGDSNTVIPPPNFDATRNGKGTVIVKYEDAEFYPEYVIRYARNNGKKMKVFSDITVCITITPNGRVIFH